MIKQGVIKNMESGTALVEVMQSCGSDGCHSCGCCGGKPGDSGSFELEVKADSSYGPGDVVELDVDMPNEAVLALIVFGVPLAAIIVLAMVGASLVEDSGAGMVIGGIVGMVAGFILVGIINRLFKGLLPKGEITRKLQPSQL